MNEQPKRPKRIKNLGALHSLLIRGLPDWVDENGLLLVYDLAKHCGVSYQAVYKWLSRGRISKKRVEAIIHLSKHTKKRSADFKPLTHDDFWDFIG